MPRRLATAQKLRQRQTDAERLLWSQLRARRLDGLKWRRQVPVGNRVADFLCIDARLIVELDGGHHAEQDATDALRTAELEQDRFVVIRFWNHEVMQHMNMVLDTILEHVVAARRHFPEQGSTDKAAVSA
jgi:very-short-patch-repair endonuclease